MFARLIAARKDEEGFTLIELLVVIIIIGILAAIAIPVFLNQRTSAAKASLTSDARNGAVQVETYYTDNQAYPTAAVIAPAAPAAGQVQVVTSKGNTIAKLTSAADSYTLCVEATTGSATGWSVTYDSAKGGTQPPAKAKC